MFSKKLSMVAGYCAIATFGLLFIVSSCKREKDDTNVNPEETGYAEEQLMLEQIYDNADRMVERAFTLGTTALKGGENPLGTCAEITKDTTTNPDIKRMIINFGGGKCLGYDGRYRSGRLIVDYSHKLKMTDPGYYHKITFDLYVVDGQKLGGHRQVWNKGKNAAGNMTYEIASVDTIYLSDNSGKVTGASERMREWYMGAATAQTSDDVYRLTGIGNFTRPNKEKYYIEIAEPLVDALSCNWINDGVINIYPESATQRVLDFGDGQCENDATINVNGVTRTVLIP